MHVNGIEFEAWLVDWQIEKNIMSGYVFHVLYMSKVGNRGDSGKDCACVFSFLSSDGRSNDCSSSLVFSFSSIPLPSRLSFLRTAGDRQQCIKAQSCVRFCFASPSRHPNRPLEKRRILNIDPTTKRHTFLLPSKEAILDPKASLSRIIVRIVSSSSSSDTCSSAIVAAAVANERLFVKSQCDALRYETKTHGIE